MELVLVRHGQPAWSRERSAQVDPELTELGHRQAALTAERLAALPIDRVFVSTARRAQQTAEPIRARLDGVPAEDREWLHEIRSPGAWQGTPVEEIGRVLREARGRPRAAWWDGLPGGESFRDFHARVTSGLGAELAALGIHHDQASGLWDVPDDDDRRLLLVAHAGTNSVVLGHLLGLEPEPWEWERFASDHTSLTLLRSVPISGGHIFSLQRFSDVGHLPAELVTA
jgi:broad specificity phosphatase PhoE